MKSERALFTKCTFHMFLAITLLFLLSFTLVSAETMYPKPTDLKYINDYTSTIDASTKEYIVSVGKEIEDKTGAQAVVVVVDSLQGSDIAIYSNELFRTWGIGQKDKNNGLLILVSVKDKKWRVEVGTSLEGAIPDIYSARVMDSVATPKFKEGNYSEGIKESYSMFADSIAKEYNVTLDKKEKVNLPANNNAASSATGNRTIGMLAGILVVVFVILDFVFNRGRITLFIISIAFWFGGNGGGGNDDSGGFGGMGGGSSSGGGSSGGW